MDSSDVVREKVKAFRSSYKRNPNKYETPPSIEYLVKSLEAVDEFDDKDDVFDLYGNLCMEYIKYKMFDKALHLFHDRTNVFKENPIAWISLAEHLIFFEKDYAEAKRISKIAVNVSKEKGQFIRHAYNNLARSARGVEDYKLLENTLSDIMKIHTLPGRGDIGFETDFLSDLPKGVVDEKLLSNYYELAK